MPLFNTKSFLRQEQYQELKKLNIDGEILDVGGSKYSGYLELIGGNHQVVVGNINPDYGIDVKFDAENPWPFDSDRFSGVLFINLLEHLFGYQFAISEAYRVLHVGGRVVGVVPFMFPVHGSPNDYFRFTASALERILKNSGFHSVKVKALGSGAFSVAYHTFIGFVRWNWLVPPLIGLCRLGDRILLKLKKDHKMSSQFMTLGYYFEAEK